MQIFVEMSAGSRPDAAGTDRRSDDVADPVMIDEITDMMFAAPGSEPCLRNCDEPGRQ